MILEHYQKLKVSEVSKIPMMKYLTTAAEGFLICDSRKWKEKLVEIGLREVEIAGAVRIDLTGEDATRDLACHGLRVGIKKQKAGKNQKGSLRKRKGLNSRASGLLLLTETLMLCLARGIISFILGPLQEQQ